MRGIASLAGCSEGATNTLMRVCAQQLGPTIVGFGG